LDYGAKSHELIVFHVSISARVSAHKVAPHDPWLHHHERKLLPPNRNFTCSSGLSHASVCIIFKWQAHQNQNLFQGKSHKGDKKP